MKVNNPFILTGYISDKYFCNRTGETSKLLSSIKNYRNTTIYSLRRMGKTGLIHHTFSKLRNNKNTILIYCDIYQTQNLNDFVKVFSNTILRAAESKPEKFYKKAIEIFKSIKPKVTADRFTGEPSLEFGVDYHENLLPTLSEIFGYLKSKSKSNTIVIAIDEFQQILNYPEKNVEAILRTGIQELQNVRFIFSGSRKHLMQSIFTGSSRPFYQSTEMMNLEKIDANEYGEFISKKFSENHKYIKEKAIDKILNFTESYTYYVQYFCNKLYSNYDKEVTEIYVDETESTILKENESIFLEYKNLIPLQQWNLVRAISKEKGIESITSMAFIKKYGLTAPSTVSNSIKALLEKEIIYFESGGYYVYDLFFSKWLERN